ncbi:MAG: cysteine--tRNA ligase [Akkermansia sp.]
MLHLYDTQSRTEQDLRPIDGQSFRFYCCGPTVYGPAHIGNFRTFVIQDVFRRVMELGGVPTVHIRNLTDVDDKTIRDSQKAGMSLLEFTEGWSQKFHADCIALNCLTPHHEPSAVAHIPEQIKMVEQLVAHGHAYASDDGSVYFKISSYSNYGQLSHLDTRELDLGKTANARSNADEYEKDSVADFVLWKARRPEDGPNYWSSPWGEGRPGWHLECSAMIGKYFGQNFDLHSGGIDLVFPHHENEIAQSRCACGGDFANHWFHITHLLVNGGKMSKSLGNMYTLSDLEKLGHSPAAVRYVLSGGYYRRPLNFTLDSLNDAKAALTRLAKFDKSLENIAPNQDLPTYHDFCHTQPELGEFSSAWEALNNDLNTPEALGHVFSAIKRVNLAELTPQQALKTHIAFHFIMEAFGIILPMLNEENADIPDEIKELAKQRWQAKQDKNWALSDTLRQSLTDAGWSIKDRKDGYDIVHD